MMDPNQMSIFDLAEEWGGNEAPPIPFQKDANQTKKIMEELSGKAIRLNEYHFSTKMVGPEFLAYLVDSKKSVGDIFTIEEVREYYKRKGFK